MNLSNQISPPKSPQLPLKRFPIIDLSNNKEVGFEIEASGFTSKNNITNILFAQNNPWYEIFRADYYNQSYANRETEHYKISHLLSEQLGYWEGFVTSFVWRKIQFKNVFVQIALGQDYFLPIELMKQVQEKVDIKCSKLDPKIINEISNKSVTWGKENNENQKQFNREVFSGIDFIGKIN